MGRKLKLSSVQVQGRAIDPAAVYRLDELPTLLRMSLPFLRREARQGRLRSKIVGGKYLFRGEWLLAYLERQDAQPAEPAQA